MQVTLQHFEACPNWKHVHADLQALRNEGMDLALSHQLVETPEEAAALGFRGSPTVLIDDADPFADPNGQIGLSCRVYVSENGLAGRPTRAQLRAAILTNKQ